MRFNFQVQGFLRRTEWETELRVCDQFISLSALSALANEVKVFRKLTIETFEN